MHKLKDWPVDGSFAEKVARHNDDFVAMLSRCAALRALGTLGMLSTLIVLRTLSTLCEHAGQAERGVPSRGPRRASVWEGAELLYT